MSIASGLLLEPFMPAHRARLEALLAEPDVFAFLSDGAPPPPAAIDAWADTARVDGEPFGLWVLVDGDGVIEGCVRVSAYDGGLADAELTYVLHPRVQGRGLATAMSRAALERAFRHPRCRRVLAGADLANVRSIAVMERLGMRRARSVEYPAGPGVEYVLDASGLVPPKGGDGVGFAEA